MTFEEQLAHSIMMKFGTSGGEPNKHQLNQIIIDLSALQATGIHPTIDDWRKIVFKHCPSAGKYRYSGVDNSDLNTLLALALQVAKGQR
jgi:hypothetical protein